MAADALFRLVAEVAAFHSRSASGRVTVIPVIVDDLKPALLAFEALCQIVGGRLLDASGDDLRARVPATTDVTRISAVETALTTTPSGGTRHVVLASADGTIDAELADPPAGAELSGGEQMVLGVARAAVHADLDTHELGVIAWADGPVDVFFRPALWSLVVDQFQDLPSATLKTLVVVIEARIDVRLHCQQGRGFRLGLENARLVQRHGPDALSAFAAEVAARDTPFVFFLGAGVGASSRLPLGNTVRDEAIRRLLGISANESVASDELAHRYHEFVAGHPDWLTDEERLMSAADYAQQLTLEQVIRAERRMYPLLPTLAAFKSHHDAVIGTPGQGIVDLAHAAETMVGRLVIVEVNFDTLVESHFHTPPRVFASDDEFGEASAYLDEYFAGTETAVPVLKIHGTIDRFDTCIISDDQTGLGVGPNKLATLRHLLDPDDPRLWVYIGTSMRDRDLSRVFADEDWARGVDERWVVPYLVETIEALTVSRAPFWEDRPRRTIDGRLTTETADAFFAALRSALGV